MRGSPGQNQEHPNRPLIAKDVISLLMHACTVHILAQCDLLDYSLFKFGTQYDCYYRVCGLFLLSLLFDQLREVEMVLYTLQTSEVHNSDCYSGEDADAEPQRERNRHLCGLY